MALDSNGIWIYSETDAEATASDLLNLLAESTSDAVEDLNDRIDAQLPETDWTALTLNSPRFALYGAGADGPVSYMRWGRMVQIHGVISPGDATAVAAVGGVGTTEDNRIATLPAGARPTKTLTYVMQGSGTARWTLNITSSGAMYANRYGGGSVATNSWMPFDQTFLLTP
ncbi:hypothetical protein ACFWH7_19575 [Cellulosimicrobium cellulans]|uniref:hypothetical protein n=1 Tax=Cellulosimicrobium cellulans TaxID=1710 RepID=UPI003665B1C6